MPYVMHSRHFSTSSVPLTTRFISKRFLMTKLSRNHFSYSITFPAFWTMKLVSRISGQLVRADFTAGLLTLQHILYLELDLKDRAGNQLIDICCIHLSNQTVKHKTIFHSFFHHRTFRTLLMSVSWKNSNYHSSANRISDFLILHHTRGRHIVLHNS